MMCMPLRQSVMEQRDPNNISGLLKLHLRENPLLTENCAALVQEALSNQNTVGTTRWYMHASKGFRPRTW